MRQLACTDDLENLIRHLLADSVEADELVETLDLGRAVAKLCRGCGWVIQRRHTLGKTARSADVPCLYERWRNWSFSVVIDCKSASCSSWARRRRQRGRYRCLMWAND